MPTSSPTAGEPDPGTDAMGGWGYQAHIDGLRALAVYLVVAFHAGLARWTGGFVGVDVFFVLSGYLVTNLLVRDLATSRRVDFGRFYSRRVRRLLPAAAVNLIVVAVVFGAIAAPVELSDARGAMRAAALYVSNWFFIRQAANYFGAPITASPVARVLVPVGRGAVLRGVAAADLRLVPTGSVGAPLAHGSAARGRRGRRDRVVGRGDPRRGPTTSTAPTTAPTHVPTSCSRGPFWR